MRVLAQCLWRDAFPLSHPAHQGLRLMSVQIIQHDVPPGRLLITGEQALKMRQGILLGAGRPPRWLDDVSRDDIEVDEPGQGAMPDVLEFPPQHMARLHGQVGMLALEGLHPSQLIHTDGPFALLSPLRRLGIQLTALDNLFVSALIGNFC